MNENAEFSPNVALAVSDREDGNWRTVESSFSDRIEVTLTGGPQVDKLVVRIPLDALQPHIGKFKFCRVALQSGEAEVFPLEWLKDPQEK